MWQFGLLIDFLYSRWKIRSDLVDAEEDEMKSDILVKEYGMIPGCPLWDYIGCSDAHLSEERIRPHQGMSLRVLNDLVITCREALEAAIQEDIEPYRILHLVCTRS